MYISEKEDAGVGLSNGRFLSRNEAGVGGIAVEGTHSFAVAASHTCLRDCYKQDVQTSNESMWRIAYRWISSLA